MNLILVCGFVTASAIAVGVIRRFSPDYSNLAAALAGIIVFGYVLESLSPFFEFIKNASQVAGAESYFNIMLKSLAISVCCKMSADICRDCGEASLASKVELAGKAGIVVLSLPVVNGLLKLAEDFIG